MLILARKKDEKVIISRNGKILCEIMITDIHSGNVRLGFEAMSDLSIDREEVFTDKYPPKDFNKA